MDALTLVMLETERVTKSQLEFIEISQTQPVLISSRDYALDFEAGELAEELVASTTGSVLDQSCQIVDADEFDSLYRWFIS